MEETFRVVVIVHNNRVTSLKSSLYIAQGQECQCLFPLSVKYALVYEQEYGIMWRTIGQEKGWLVIYKSVKRAS